MKKVIKIINFFQFLLIILIVFIQSSCTCGKKESGYIIKTVADLKVNDGSIYNFGDVSVGKAVFAGLVLENTGNSKVVFSSKSKISIEGKNSSDFNLDISLLKKNIAAKETSNFFITFNPKTIGVKQAVLLIDSDPLNKPYKIKLRGIANPISYSNPKFIIKTDTNLIISDRGIYDFGDVSVGDSNYSRLSIENIGESVILLSKDQDIIIDGDNSSDFTLDSSSLQNNIDIGESSDFNIRFNPSTIGNKEAYLEIKLKFRNEPVIVKLEGSAIPRMNLVTAGIFKMGFEKIKIATPVHIVYISDFEIAETEVSYILWRSVVNWAVYNGYHFENRGAQGYKSDKGRTNGRHPVTSITWYDAIAWCNALSEMYGLEPIYYSDLEHTKVYRNSAQHNMILNDYAKWEANGFRLPTEAEYEFVARNKGIREGLYQYSGGDDLDELGWYIENSNGGTNAIGSKKANELGVYDLSGNVYEWCWDWYGSYNEKLQSDPKGPTGPFEGLLKVIRGGAWDSEKYKCEISERNSLNPGEKANNVGFRFVRKKQL